MGLIGGFLGPVWEFLKQKPYWSRLQPIVAFLSLYLAVQVAAYQFIQWQYGLSPSLALYLRSYLFRQITLAFGVILVLLLVLGRRRRDGPTATTRLGRYLSQHGRRLAVRAIAAVVVLALATPLFLYLSPNDVSHIRVKFLREPELDKYALVYLIYELNRMQEAWYFEIDFDTFNEGALTSDEHHRCAGRGELCWAELLAEDRPFIGITSEGLGADSLWQNRGRVSVISTDRWSQYEPPSEYEFVLYSLIVQSVLIHLNENCRGLPEGAFREGRVSYGDLFQFLPRRHAMKAAILAPQLSRGGEQLLFNCFGAEYLATSSRILALEWLHSDRILANLRKSFGVEI